MLRWSFKSLFSQKGSLIGSVLGIASAFVLVIFFDAVWRGESVQIIAYPKNVKPDVWVMQNGVGNMHMAMSFVWDWKADKIKEMPGVKNVTPILYLNNVITAGDHEMFAFIVGLLSDYKRAGPWELSSGRNINNKGEIVVPDIFTKLAGVGIGDDVFITNRKFTIVGFSKGTYSSANAILFITFSDLEHIMSSFGTYSYLLVDTEEGVNEKLVANNIINEIDKVNALTHEKFIKNDYAMAKQMGVEIIVMMTSICTVLAALIVGFTSYSLVISKKRELSIIKALGMNKIPIIYSVVLQSGFVTFMGFLLAGLISLILIPFVPIIVPQLTVIISFNSILNLAIISLIVAIIGALIPAYLVLRLDPATAFNI
ncbi:MAG: FtsX-like permease family protein [Candidatus Dadabacteria bacterium]|nr:FtsX-like permease family protein [Candidatus Dadabacteria bacterium]